MKDLIEDIEFFYEKLVEYFFGCILCLTSPLWILPYVIYKNKKGGTE